MRIYTRAGDLAFKTFTFPDGQPHFKLETYEVEFPGAHIEMALRSPHDLLLLALAAGVLRASGYSTLNLDIRYLLGARMDRAISSLEPFTLDVVARFINSLGFNQVRILDVHSEVATRLIRNATNVLPRAAVRQTLSTLGTYDVVIPDKGAEARVFALMVGVPGWIHNCYKDRDPATGKLSNFRVPSEGLRDRNLLIIDDICDGGGTFTGLAKALRERGAKTVNLFVTHGIFSKGLPLDGINRVFTTDSFYTPTSALRASGEFSYEPIANFTVIPISMKEQVV